eukprot:11758738-Alexandrium_andersonii.AAC.1
MERLRDCWENHKSTPWDCTESWATHIYRELNEHADHLANHGAAGHVYTFSRGFYIRRISKALWDFRRQLPYFGLRREWSRWVGVGPLWLRA